MPEITEEEHIERHKVLHKHFDELLADFIDKARGTLSQTKLIEFLEWSYQQTIKPVTERAPVEGE